MFNSTVLDVFIGLIFIYLLYSLLATIIQEMIARMFSLRTWNLLKAMRVMLEDRDNKKGNTFLFSPLLRFWEMLKNSIYYLYNPFPKQTFTKAFYDSPSIKYLGQNEFRSKPAYINQQNFSQTIIRLLRGISYDGTQSQMELIENTLFKIKGFVDSSKTGATVTPIDPETLQQLQQLYIDAHKDIDRFKAHLENWFNETMDRASGWYKKRTQLILLIVGFSIALIFNVDTIAIYNLLAKDKSARQDLVTLATSTMPRYDSLVKATKQQHKTITVTDTVKRSNGTDSVFTRTVDSVFVAMSDKELDQAYGIVMSDIDKANSIAALGWPNKDSCKKCSAITDSCGCAANVTALQRATDSMKHCQKQFNCNNPYQNKNTRWWGWILTAVAISLGAPFWFDLLSKLVQIRGSGPKPSPAAPGSGNLSTPDNGNDPTSSSPIERVG